MAARQVASALRPVTRPPVVAPETAAELAAAGATFSASEVALALGKSTSTIENWVRDRRIRSQDIGPGTRMNRRIPEAEIERVRAILAPAAPLVPIDPPPAADVAPADADTGR